jgi:hypothetical protein
VFIHLCKFCPWSVPYQTPSSRLLCLIVGEVSKYISFFLETITESCSFILLPLDHNPHVLQQKGPHVAISSQPYDLGWVIVQLCLAACVCSLGLVHVEMISWNGIWQMSYCHGSECSAASCPSLTWIRSKILSFCHFVSSLLFCCRLHHQCLITDPFQSTFPGKEVEEILYFWL